jgi:hypothetical protein
VSSCFFFEKCRGREVYAWINKSDLVNNLLCVIRLMDNTTFSVINL